jgi:hypothetical protein
MPAKNVVPMTIVYHALLVRLPCSLGLRHTLIFPPVFGVAMPGPVDIFLLNVGDQKTRCTSRRQSSEIIAVVDQGKVWEPRHNILLIYNGPPAMTTDSCGSIQMRITSPKVAIAPREGLTVPATHQEGPILLAVLGVIRSFNDADHSKDTVLVQNSTVQ